MSKFSPQLIARITKYFREKYEIEITEAEATEYLHAWAGLWSIVARGSGAPAGRAHRA